MSFRKLMILGHLVGLFTLILGNPTAPPSETTEELQECRDKFNAQARKFGKVLDKEFSEEERNATAAMYPDSNFIECEHFCRKMDVVQRSIKETSDVLRTFSNKSEEMVPFLRSFMHEGLQALCDNDGQLIKVFFSDDYGRCISYSVTLCQHFLEGIERLDRIAVCDYTEPENDPYSKKFICQKLHDHLECVKVETEECSEEMTTSVAGLISKISEEAFCGKYLNAMEN